MNFIQICLRGIERTRLIVIGFFVLLSAAILLRSLTQPAYAERGGNERRRGVDTIATRLSTSSFLVLNDHELSRFGDPVWYHSFDSLQAPAGVRVHANEAIRMRPGAFSTAFITSTNILGSPLGCELWARPRPGYQEYVVPVVVPNTIYPLWNAACESGTYLNSDSGRYTYGLVFAGSSASLYRRRTGATPTFGQPEQVVGTISWTTTDNQPYAIVCDGPLWVKGRVAGKVGIGAHGSIRLMGDIVSDGVTQENWWIPVVTDTTNLLTIATDVVYIPTSGQENGYTGIVIANTLENGRENGKIIYQPDRSRRDIVITAQLLAVNSMFTFEDQNDVWEPYRSPTTPDERGTVHLRGSMVQRYRGYVHRSNNGGTGYEKDYRYDVRYLKTPPPYSIPVR